MIAKMQAIREDSLILCNRKFLRNPYSIKALRAYSLFIKFFLTSFQSVRACDSIGIENKLKMDWV